MNQERLQLALDAAGLGLFEWDLVRDVLVVSAPLATLSGLPAGESPAAGGAAWDAHVESEAQGFLVRIRDLGQPFKLSIRRTQVAGPAGGGEDARWLHIAGDVQKDGRGRPVSVTGVVSDISAYKAEEDQRQRLFAELDHRVKNVLASVQALAYQTAKRTTSLDAFLTNFTGRLKALGAANELLTAARWRGAAIDHIVSAELGALSPGQTSWEGPEMFLTPRATNALALALHELAANAVKFGALSVETGDVAVRWTRAGEGFELTWTESGGPTVGPPARRGFGATLLEQVTGRELNGGAEVEYRPSGMRARLHAGAAAMAPRPDSMPEVAAPRVVETVAAAQGFPDLKGARVLIVEDAVLLALELETGLSEAGAEVVGPAYELEEALALLDQPIDGAVLDANLNGRSVTPVAEALAARGVPFVFATGYGDTGGAPGGFDAPVIRKPYDVTQVAAAIAALLKT